MSSLANPWGAQMRSDCDQDLVLNPTQLETEAVGQSGHFIRAGSAP